MGISIRRIKGRIEVPRSRRIQKVKAVAQECLRDSCYDVLLIHSFMFFNFSLCVYDLIVLKIQRVSKCTKVKWTIQDGLSVPFYPYPT